MQRDAVAFRVEDFGAESVRSDRVHVCLHSAAVGSDGSNGVVEAAINAEVNHNAVRGWLEVIHDDNASFKTTIGSGDHADAHLAECLFFDGFAEDGGVETDG